MTNVCKFTETGGTICDNIGTKLKPGSYERGYRFCRMCNWTFLTEKYKCPCCGAGLRCSPKAKK